MGLRLRVWVMRAVAALDRARLRRLARRHPGLEIADGASSALALARFELGPGAQLRIGDGVVTERRSEGVRFHLGAGARVEIGEGTWLRSDVAPVQIVAFDGAVLRTGPRCFLNGCHLSAKREVILGERAWVGPGSRVFDSDQHDLDDARPESTAPVHIGDHVWVAADVTILKGVRIGEHSIVGTRSLVLRDVPPHTLVAGSPAGVCGSVGDRSRTR